MSTQPHSLAVVGPRQNAAQSAALVVERLEVSYGNVNVLKGLSFSVEAGQTVAIVGPNGAGKSTLLRTISGLVKPQHGSIRLGGQDLPWGEPHNIAAKGVIQVPESREIFAGMTVWENLKIPFDNLNPAGDESSEFERVYELFPVLKSRREDYAGNLSGGQQQMLAIGRALLSRPRLLMIDEPSLGLARIVFSEIYKTFAALRRAGTTILLVEQNARMAIDFADFSHVLVNGRFVLSGQRDDMLKNPDVFEHYMGKQ